MFFVVFLLIKCLQLSLLPFSSYKTSVDEEEIYLVLPLLGLLLPYFFQKHEKPAFVDFTFYPDILEKVQIHSTMSGPEHSVSSAEDVSIWLENKMQK